MKCTVKKSKWFPHKKVAISMKKRFDLYETMWSATVVVRDRLWLVGCFFIWPVRVSFTSIQNYLHSHVRFDISTNLQYRGCLFNSKIIFSHLTMITSGQTAKLTCIPYTIYPSIMISLCFTVWWDTSLVETRFKIKASLTKNFFVVITLNSHYNLYLQYLQTLRCQPAFDIRNR